MNKRDGALIVYFYKSCDTCRRALRWLAQRGIEVVEKPIRETPPSVTELRMMLLLLGGERRRLCNTAGADYRLAKLGERIEGLAEADFLGLLATNGNLVKRPFLIRLVPALGLVGFSEPAWEAALVGLD